MLVRDDFASACGGGDLIRRTVVGRQQRLGEMIAAAAAAGTRRLCCCSNLASTAAGGPGQASCAGVVTLMPLPLLCVLRRHQRCTLLPHSMLLLCEAAQGADDQKRQRGPQEERRDG